MTDVVEARGVSKWYGEVLGLNGFSAAFAPGITGLVGPNGAGKSTLFKLLIGQLHKDQGELRLLGEDPWNNVALKRRLGYCPEHNQLYGWLTADRFVSSLLRLDGMPSSEATRRAHAALEVVGLTGAKDRTLRTYSRGMRQRAKLAQALAHDPEILILDEPLSGADPQARVHILRTIADFVRDGGHVLMSTHVLYEV
ncbi:MAG: ABC transporter ATP-binding protein, partial [Methanobacteriota archaeon]